MRKEIEVFIELAEGIEMPNYAKLGDSGLDIRASEDVYIHPNETKIIPTGIKVAIPDGYEIQVRPRSGLSYNTPLRVSNSPGTIDVGFRSEIGVIMTNTSVIKPAESILEGCIKQSTEFTIEDKGNCQGIYHIRKGDRICQIVLMEVPYMKLTKVDSVMGIGVDRGGGFGSTGCK
jgi:dUTP pyrophosphatase